MINKYKIIIYLTLVFIFTDVLHAEKLPVGEFSLLSLSGWETKEFEGKTAYKLVPLENKNVLMAVSDNSASGLTKEIRVDLIKYPYLNWSWRIDNKLSTKNEKIKSGDDYAARVYVVIDGGILFWRTKAINYVWANESSKEEVWENAFAGKNAMMMALRNSKDELSTWYTEKRNVYKDLKRIFGSEYKFIDVVAIMTDTDNSHGHVKSYYDDIYFSSQ